MSNTRFGVYVFILLLIFLAFVFGWCVIVNMTQRDYEFRNAVHSHMENAYYSADPRTMETELIAAKEGMKSLGLTNDMYAAWLPWDKTPDRRMDWQYKHMDSILERVQEFKQWESQQIGSDTSQQMQDVYSQKLDNVRHFIYEEGWSDDVAEGAYAYNFYFLTTLGSFFALIVGFIILLILMGYVIIVCS